MPPSKRHRKSKKSQEGNSDGDSSGNFALEHVIDSGVIYGKSLPINRLRALIKGESIQIDIGEPSGGATSLGRLAANFRLYLDSLKRRPVTQDYLLQPSYTRFFRTGFNAYWSDFEYGPPVGLDVVGRGALGCLDRNDPVLDVSVKLPQDMFNPKDHVNYRYLNKRNAWMCCLYEDLLSCISKGDRSELLGGIPNAKLKVQLRFRNYKVYVQLVLLEEVKYTLCVLTHVDGSTFKRVSLTPSRNNVRIPTTLPVSVELSEPVAESELRPTPTYNAAILDDMLREEVNQRIGSYFTEYHKLKGALTLLTTWSRTQGLTPLTTGEITDHQQFTENYANRITNKKEKESKDSIDGVPSGRKSTPEGETESIDIYNEHNMPCFYNGMSGFILCFILCHVAKCNEFPVGVEAFPLFLAAIKFIASMDTSRFSYVFGKLMPIPKKDISGEPRNDPNFDQPQFFFDEEMTLNILYRMPFTFQELVDRAKATLTATSDMSSPFLYSQLFELPYSVHCHSDVKIHFQRCELKSSFEVWELRRSDYLAGKLRFVLEYGLKDRLDHVYFRFGDNDELVALIGLVDSVQRKTDVGPPSNSEEAVFFREFWGKLSETRSFEDGSICECLLWSKLEEDPDTMGPPKSSFDFIRATHINSGILMTLLQLHFREYNLSIKNKWGESDRSYLAQKKDRLAMALELPLVEYNSLIGTEYRSKLMNVYNELNEMLRHLENVPLKPSTIFTCSPAFGYADVSSTKVRHRLLLGLESSARWPNGNKAIRSAKVALGIAMLKELYKDHDVKSRITVEGDMEVKLMGVKFSMSIICHKETQETIDTIRHFDYNVDKRPTEPQLVKVRDYFRSLQVDRCKVVALKNPSFTSSVLLCKSFCSSLMLPDCEFLCEMLNCYIFGSHRFMLPLPHSGNAGFMRFVYLLARYDWSTNPLILHDEKPDDTLLGIKKPSCVPYIWISTPEDPFCLVPKMPSALLSKRVISQCQRFLDVMETNLLKCAKLNSFLTREQEGYNVVLELENIHSKLKYSARNESIKLSTCEAIYLVETFVANLKATYEGLIEVAYNELEIRGIQRSTAPLKVFLKFNPLAAIPSRHPKGQWPQQVVRQEDTSMFVLNFPAIVNGIRSLGEGLIREIRFLQA